MNGVVHRRSKRTEALGVLFLATAILLALCLFSYDPWDPSFNVDSRRTVPHNYIGKIGAFVADLLFQTLGTASFLVILPPVLLGWRSFAGNDNRRVVLKMLGFLSIILCIAAGLETVSFRLPYETNFSGGGVLGGFLSDMLQEYLNLHGAVIVLLTLLALSILLATNLSLQGIGKVAVAVPATAIGGAYRNRKMRREARKRLKIEPRSATSVTQSAAGSAAGKIPLMTKPTAEPAGRPLADDRGPLPAAKAASASRSAVLLQEARSSEARSVETAKTAVPISSKFDILRLDKYLMPDVNFLEKSTDRSAINEGELMELARMLQEKSAEFDVHGNVTQIHPGPIVTTFEFKPDTGVKYSRIVSLVDDLCLAMRAESIRIDRIPGKSTVGIEVPNRTRDTILLREIIESEAFRKSKSKLTLALGKLINGDPYVTDLAKMPHLLIAGATGSGKSVGVNSMITSILYKAAPDEVKFIMIDPKRLELGMYADIPHLLTPIVTDPKRAANVLHWATSEMEGRYKRMACHGVRNIDQYNQFIRSTQREFAGTDDEALETIPSIVVVIDELADLMILAGKDVEESITRLAQMARAVGIHLILATQRPSVDVITGLIKANFPSRISFRVSSKIDSRTILDANGAEQLLGNGDMLFLPPGSSRLLRIHGAYISEAETQRIIEFLKSQALPKYNEKILEYCKEAREVDIEELEENDPLYADAVRIVLEMRKASTSVLQRRLKIGYGRAARLIDLMERDGIVGPPDGSKPREVLKPPDYYREVDERL